MPLDPKPPKDCADPKKKAKFICKDCCGFIFNDNHDFAVLFINQDPLWMRNKTQACYGMKF